MAMHESIRAVSKIAGEALTIYRFCSLQSDGKYDETGAAAEIDGIAGESVALDKVFPMIVPDSGEAKVELGATVARGVQLQSDGSGRAILHVTTAGVGKAGKSLAAGVIGDIIAIDFRVSTDEVT